MQIKKSEAQGDKARCLDLGTSETSLEDPEPRAGKMARTEFPRCSITTDPIHYDQNISPPSPSPMPKRRP